MQKVTALSLLMSVLKLGIYYSPYKQSTPSSHNPSPLLLAAPKKEAAGSRDCQSFVQTSANHINLMTMGHHWNFAPGSDLVHNSVITPRPK